ncbi:glutathione synthase [Cellulomonas chitinilytica]|uniref:Glutathione synthase n=1 Tax=Cellulomonas chitinilytica TaxID=398759 RepID=A0A919NZP6_9CELL|nr:alpha-L-glutamate ligase [Cellulomonas chitinilytica]GIG19990.1 glutathione synthase [Cellulomonas chitinilytica]
MSTVVVLHDNPDWLPPFERAFAREGVRLEPWHLGSTTLDLADVPQDAVFWSRLSASAHTRGVPHAYPTAVATLDWLEASGRRVVNGSAVAALEVSKVRQYARLAAAGFDVPRTIAVAGTDGLVTAAATFGGPFITKHNRGGKGLGVRRYEDADELAAALADGLVEPPVDGLTLLQELLVAPEPFVTRAEFAGGAFHYAVRVDTSGGFELCPAEACAVPTATAPLFSVREDVTAEHPLVTRLGRFLAAQGVEIAGVEFFETVDGRVVPYDINTNTNYSPDVESSVGDPAAAAVARFLGGLARDAGRLAA